MVAVARGIGDVWQAKDRKYYQRFNYENLPMEHYQIEMVRARSVGPSLKMVFGLNDRWDKALQHDIGEKTTIFVGIQNDASSIAEAALIELGVAHLSVQGYGHDFLGPFSRVGTRSVRMQPSYSRKFDWYECYWPVHVENMGIAYRPIFKTNNPLRVTQLGVKGPFDRSPFCDVTQGWLFWHIQSANMNLQKGMTRFLVGRHGGLRLEESNEPFEID